MSTSPGPSKFSAARSYNCFNLMTFTIGSKLTNTINVAVQLQDARGNLLQQIAYARCYLSDNANGSTLTATATTSAIAIGTNGVILDTPVSYKAVDVIFNSGGMFDLNIIQTATPQAYYLVVIMPDGSITVSPVIQF